MGRLVLVTGAASGIEFTIASACVAEHAHVLMIDRNEAAGASNIYRFAVWQRPRRSRPWPFLLSDESSYCTGTAFPVDGGLSAGI